MCPGTIHNSSRRSPPCTCRCSTIQSSSLTQLPNSWQESIARFLHQAHAASNVRQMSVPLFHPHAAVGLSIHSCAVPGANLAGAHLLVSITLHWMA
jgi:hypothetical protein